MMSGTEHPFHGAPAPTAGNTQTGSEDLTDSIDSQVAADFFQWPRHQSIESRESPRLVGLLYGLLCVDVAGKEVLLPNPRGIGHDAGHVARIWFEVSSLTDLQVPSAATGFDVSTAFGYFDIAGSKVEFKAIDARGRELPYHSPLETRNNPQHPWMNENWVRCLKKLSKLPMIEGSERDDTDLVTARIRLETGKVGAVPPFGRDGQHNEWRVRQIDNTDLVSATTDSMLWSRPLPPEVDKVLMTITPLGGGSGKTVGLTPKKGQLLFVATHATTQNHTSNPTRLTHTTAFARLLKGGDPSTFPVPVLEGIPRPYAALSASDVHCECSCP